MSLSDAFLARLYKQGDRIIKQVGLLILYCQIAPVRKRLLYSLQGDEGDGMYFVQEGIVRILKLDEVFPKRCRHN